jgi:hypothetical protein
MLTVYYKNWGPKGYLSWDWEMIIVVWKMIVMLGKNSFGQP